MRTSDVMSSPVVTVPPDAQLKDVAAALVEHGINAVPVVDDGDRLVGIVSEADLLTLEATPGTQHRPGSAARQGPPHTAREVMSHSVYTLTEDTDAAAAARLMLRHGLKSVPVVAGDRVVGMVARRDLLRLIARSDHDIRADLEHHLKETADALQRLVVDVTDGVVTIDAAVGPLARQLLEGLARTVPGVTEIRTS
jgi:CBS domain-containing protein